MAEEGGKKVGNNKEFIKEQIRSTFSALNDAKFEKAWDSLTDESL